MNNLPELSRRSFIFGTAVGSLSFLGCISTPLGSLLAFADEDDNRVFELVVLSRNDIVALAIDPSTNTVVSDMEITINSFAEDAKTKTLTLLTNNLGIATANVRDLSENNDDESPTSGYEFWASIEAHARGYRDFACDLTRIVSGPNPIGEDGKRPANITIPTQKYDGGKDVGYLRKLSFDDFDIQYFVSSFIASSANDEEHTLSVEIVASAGANVSASFLYGGSELGSASGKAGSDGHATLNIKGKFLQTSNSDQETQVFFEIDGKKFEAPCNLNFIGGADGLEDATKESNATMSPGNPESNPLARKNLTYGSYRIKLPEDLPIFGGTYYDLPLPEFPIAFTFDPLGLLAIGLSLDLLPVLPGIPSGPNKDSWKCMRRETWSDYRARREADNCKACQRAADAKNIKEGGSAQGKQTKFGGVELLFDFTFCAQGTWEWFSNIWTAGVNASFIAGATYEWGQQTCIAGFPVFYGFDLSFKNTFQFYIGAQMESLFKSISWHPKDFGFTYISRFDFGVTFAAGVKGCLSLGLRGYVYFQSSLALVKTDKPLPHLTAGFGAVLTIVWQILFTGGTIGVFNYSKPKFWDNWEGLETTSLQESLSVPKALRNSRAFYLLEDGSVIDLEKFPPAAITKDNMLALSEYTAKADEFSEDDGSHNIKLDSSYLTSAKKATGNAAGGFGIVPADNNRDDEDFDSTLGVVPSVDTCIYKNVSSDSKHKIIKGADGTLWLVRLAIVNVQSYKQENRERYFKLNSATNIFEKKSSPLSNEELNESFEVPRSRVTICSLNSSTNTWSEPKIIEFDSSTYSESVYRPNCNDYDFAIEENPNKAGTFYLSIVSGNVTEEDEFEDRWKSQFITNLIYDAKQSKVTSSICLLSDFKGSCCFSPSVNYHSGIDKLIFSWVSAKFDGDGAIYQLNSTTFDSDNFSDNWKLVHGVFRPYGYTTAMKYINMYAEKGPNWTDSGNIPSVAWIVPALESGAIKANAYKVVLQNYLKLQSSSATFTFKEFNYSDTTPPVVIPDKGWIYTDTLGDIAKESIDRKMLMLELVDSDLNVEKRNVGLANMTSFGALKDGSKLYAVCVEEGEVPSTLASDVNPGVDSEVVGEDPREAHEVANYTLYAANWDSKRKTYHHFYPLAQASHPIDIVEECKVENGRLSFVATEIVDSEAGLGNIWQMNVPLVCAAEISGIAPSDSYCGPGDTCHVTVSVQNTGNLPIETFGIKLYDNAQGSGSPLVNEWYENLEEAMFNNIEDYQGKDESGNSIYSPDEIYYAQKNKVSGILQADTSIKDYNGLLWPGQERSYGGIEFTVPESWAAQDSTKVYAFLYNPQPDEQALADALSGAAPGSESTTLASLSKTASLNNFEVAGDVGADSHGVFTDTSSIPETFDLSLAGLQTSNENIKQADYTLVEGDDDSDSDETDSTSSGLPETGDRVGKITVPTAIVGASAAAMVAYSKRRCENEELKERSKHAND